MKIYLSENLKVPENVLSVYTTRSQALQINKIIKNYINPDCILTDATAGIGGNAVYFIKEFKSVNLVEKDPEMFNFLIENTQGTNSKIINKYNCSYYNIKFMLKQDIVFIDPPWGKNYKDLNKIDLFLDDINIMDIINSVYNFTRIVALKAPNNYNLDKINNNFWDHCVYNITKMHKNLYKLIIFYKKV
jgi:16S rRNA G966 N2-methylase RsmD